MSDRACLQLLLIALAMLLFGSSAFPTARV